MIVAGFGFRATATVDSLTDALSQVRGAHGIDAIATLEGKGAAPAFQDFVRRANLPLTLVSEDDVMGFETLTQSPASQQSYGTGSVAEATALSAAGAGAVLLGTRAVSNDRLATCALAQAPLRSETTSSSEVTP